MEYKNIPRAEHYINIFSCFLVAIALVPLLIGCGPSEIAKPEPPYEPNYVLEVNCDERGCLCRVVKSSCSNCEKHWITCPMGVQVGAAIQFINPIPVP